MHILNDRTEDEKPNTKMSYEMNLNKYAHTRCVTDLTNYQTNSMQLTVITEAKGEKNWPEQQR